MGEAENDLVPLLDEVVTLCWKLGISIVGVITEPYNHSFKAWWQPSWNERSGPEFPNVASRVGDIDRAFAMRMPKCAGSSSHLIDKMHQMEAPGPARRKPNRVFPDGYASLPGCWLTITRIMRVVKRRLARREEIDIETGKRDRSIRDGGARSGNIETQVRWPGRRRARRDRGTFYEGCLERVVIRCGSGEEGGSRGDARIGRGLLRRGAATC